MSQSHAVIRRKGKGLPQARVESCSSTGLARKHDVMLATGNRGGLEEWVAISNQRLPSSPWSLLHL